MSSALTPHHQRNAVSEGVAFGLVLCGVYSIDFEGTHITSVELGFENSWREWQHTTKFPQVATDLRNGSNAKYVMTHADYRKHTQCFYWQDWVIHERPFLSHNEDMSEDKVAALIGGCVSVDGWKSLAMGILDFLGLASS